MASKKRRGEPADPEFAAFIAEQEERRHAEWAAGHPPAAATGPVVAGSVPVSELHAHDAGCWGAPLLYWEYRRNGPTVEVGRICQRYDLWVPDHYATAIEISAMSDAEKKRLGLSTGLSYADR